MWITLSGLQAAGKTSTANRIGDALHYDVFGVGTHISRPLAQHYGMSIEDFYRTMKRITVNGKEWDLDDYLDHSQVEWALKHPNAVVDSRLGAFMLPRERTFRVLLDVSPTTAARRLYEESLRGGRSVEHYQSIEDAHRAVLARTTDERRAYAAHYDIPDHLDASLYDFVVDSEHHNIIEMADLIVSEFKRRCFD